MSKLLPSAAYRTEPIEEQNDQRQMAYQSILQSILSLEYAPAKKLGEQELAERLGVSRTPVHDALLKLQRERLADIPPRRGAFVSCLSEERIRNGMWLQEKITLSVLHRYFMDHIEKKRLLPLSGLLRQAEKRLEEGTECYSSAMDSFYELLFQLPGCYQHLRQSLRYASGDFLRCLRLAQRDPSLCRLQLTLHRCLISALEQRNGKEACRIYCAVLSLLEERLPALIKCYPDYFCS